IRTVLFDADKGFLLNGKPVKIKGTCNHQDHAGVGSAIPDRLQYYRIERLKEMGSNGYRTSHNPPTPELLEACDRLGMLVMDETRMMSSNPEGLSQLERLVRRDRNHPSVVIWSLGNEEREQSTERGAKLLTSMKRLVRRLDPSRPVTVAMNGGWGKGFSGVVDVQGFNYAGGGGGGGTNTGKHIDDFHQQFPKLPTIGTETASDYSTRGIYANDKGKGYVSAYDVNFPGYTLSSEGWWKVYAERPFLAGGFAWTGFDYRGEPSPYAWPCISSHFGILDTCGFPKDNYFYYQAWWSEKPVLHLFPHWNWSGTEKEGQEIEVWCHTNLETVELFLNGNGLGSKKVERNGHLEWKVKYAPGVLEARGSKNGQVVLTDKRETTGAPAKLVLRPDRSKIAADGEDLSMVAVEVVDAQGRVVPTASNLVTFNISGNGRLIGVGNGDPSCHEPDKADKRSAFNGLCMVFVQALKQPGEIRIEAASADLAGASVVIQAEEAKLRPAVS
ncbi:MAG: beta-galactosidase, partial [Acidobacteria bacterium]